MDNNKSDKLEKCDFFHNFTVSVIKPESNNCVHRCFTAYLTCIDDTNEIQFLYTCKLIALSVYTL